MLLQPGDYFYGSAATDHLAMATRYSNASMARFSAQDSGATPAAPITYAAAEPESSTPVNLIGGLPLTGLTWAPAGQGHPATAFKTTLPAGMVQIDVQDQIFLDRTPLVRARYPNGRPWIPLDGFDQPSAATPGDLSTPPVFSFCNKPRASPSMPRRPSTSGFGGPAPGNCSNVQHGVCLHNAMPILRSFACVDPGQCCGNCTGDPACVGWNVNAGMKTCFLRGSYKTNPGSGCISGCVRGNCAPLPPPPPPHPHPPPPATTGTCAPATVVCHATGATLVTGVLGVSTTSGRALAGSKGDVKVDRCLEHALGLANDFPTWRAQSFGRISPCNYSADPSCPNTMYTDYNFPLWFGPWASGIKIDNHSDWAWPDASQVVVHAMAVGEWGGVQFRVASVTPAAQAGKSILKFSHGGYQQARGAAARLGRHYMEGSSDFLDVPGEWHFDPTSRELILIPPVGFAAPSVAGLEAAELLITQTDTLLEFVGKSSDEGDRVENIVLANLTFSYTSAQFFRPHEETSGGDYATHRSAAVKIENATGVVLTGNVFRWIGGNAVMLSASVRDVNVTANLFRWLGTSGVALQGKTGIAMMDGRDGERMAAAHGPAADNGVRLPTNNVVANNVFADYGIWDKQSACYHKALAPNNLFLNNVCFNSSRHGVNFQDGFGGGGVAEGNVMFNLNRETSDTTAFNSWNRRNYITSDPVDPAVGVLVPPSCNEWRRNLVLGRNYFGVRDRNGDGLRNDDGASYYNHSNNVLYLTGITFNGGTQIHVKGNLLIKTGWSMGPTPDVAEAYNNTFVDSVEAFSGSCQGFFQKPTKRGAGDVPGVYTGDNNVGVFGTANVGGPSSGGPLQFCGLNLTAWQNATRGQDLHSRSINASAPATRLTPEDIVALARSKLYKGRSNAGRR